MDESDKLDNLRAENVRLIALLEAHGIVWKKQINHAVDDFQPHKYR